VFEPRPLHNCPTPSKCWGPRGKHPPFSPCNTPEQVRCLLTQHARHADHSQPDPAPVVLRRRSYFLTRFEHMLMSSSTARGLLCSSHDHAYLAMKSSTVLQYSPTCSTLHDPVQSCRPAAGQRIVQAPLPLRCTPCVNNTHCMQCRSAMHHKRNPTPTQAAMAVT
jgi:hypothetical protein